jgi:hypothetical protein
MEENLVDDVYVLMKSQIELVGLVELKVQNPEEEEEKK